VPRAVIHLNRTHARHLLTYSRRWGGAVLAQGLVRLPVHLARDDMKNLIRQSLSPRAVWMARFSAPADLRRQPTNVPLSAHLAAARAGEANKSAFSRDPALLSDSVIMASGSAARQVACQLQALRARARFGAGRQGCSRGKACGSEACYSRGKVCCPPLHCSISRGSSDRTCGGESGFHTARSLPPACFQAPRSTRCTGSTCHHHRCKTHHHHRPLLSERRGRTRSSLILEPGQTRNLETRNFCKTFF
jgi:hypothetical protein